MDLTLNTKNVPAILPSFPPMPKPEDYGIDWTDAALADVEERNMFLFLDARKSQNISYEEAHFRISRFKAQNKLYQQALATWMVQVEQITQAIRTNK